MAFVEERLILDAILIASEAVDDWSLKGKKGVLLKLDLEKAYDKYADNTLLFSVWEEGNLEAWWRVINLFLLGAGLSLKFAKTSLVEACDRKEAWNSLEERFSLPCYLFSHLQAPVGVINRMEKMVRDLVRTGRLTKLAAYLVKCDTTSRLICYGGLGIGSFRKKNNALLTKWLWRFCKENNAFWRCLIVAIYGLEENGWSTKALNRGKFYRLSLKKCDDNEFNNVATILETLHLWAPTDNRDSLNWNLNAAGLNSRGYGLKGNIM
ncbi:hypothetical protein E5676_scaffold629G001780 [Cucumis melo var. makuwa]|uniref:Reverse transcriptase domain-containing protein n=1 Tax=Cucumis melo var. makuwa TaxID=1194695 RepID=A0A5D3DYG7_CUCMM|nr:hypothetical protein E5676_scaffold629G001780 [Cucumis melo var. makuwa]